MNRIHAWKLLVVLPAAAVLAVVLGCPPADTGKGGGGATGGGDTGSGAGQTTEAKDVVVAKDYKKGTIKGRVTLSGDPKLEVKQQDYAKALAGGKNPDHCTKDDPKNDKRYQKLVLGGADKKGVANAYVFLKADRGKHFLFEKEAADALIKEHKNPVVDQPFCAFEPHAVFLWPKYYGKDKKLVDTGLFLVVKNSAPIAHNTKWGGGKSEGGNQTIAAGGMQEIKDIGPSENEPVMLSCNVHEYMSGVVWALDHPFVAITKEDGTYEIPNVPADVDVNVVAWHELGGGGREPDFLGKPQKVKVDDGKSVEKNYTLKFE